MIGDAVNIASRLCAEAGPGEILVSEALLGVVREQVSCDYLPEMALKGKAQVVQVYRVRDMQPQRTSLTAAVPPAFESVGVPGALEQLEHQPDRQSHHAEEVAVDPLHQRRPVSLDAVRARLVHRLPRRDVGLEEGVVEPAEDDVGDVRRLVQGLVGHQRDRGHHLVRAALQLPEHPERIGGVERLLQHLVPHDDRRVRAEHQAPGHAQRLLAGQALHVVHRCLDRADAPRECARAPRAPGCPASRVAAGVGVRPRRGSGARGSCAVQDEGDGSVVVDLDQHVRAELAGGHLQSPAPERGDEALVQRDRGLGARRVDERRADGPSPSRRRA